MDNAGNETHHPSIRCMLSITQPPDIAAICYDRS